MSLGDYTRVVRTFLEAFKMSSPGASISASELSSDELEQAHADDTQISRLNADLKVLWTSSITIIMLTGMQEYDENLYKLGVKDDRIRRPLGRITLIRRLLVRGIWALVLFSLCLPGLILWTPIFLTTFYAVHQFKKTGYGL
jgi:glycerol-3-phosphate O-acyltransferase / dihydroxyacetone phosphate acyltransferase